jgi:hypothetical protein
MIRAGHVTRMGEKRNAIGYWWESQKEPLGRPRHRCMDHIKMYLRNDGVVWTGLFWLRIGTSGGLL